MITQRLQVCLSIMGLLVAGGCAQHYVTPGAALELTEITDKDLQHYFQRQPAASFPASIAVVRVQDSGYYHRGNRDRGRYAIVSTRDLESDEAYEKIQKLTHVRGVAPIGRMLVPANANGIKELRVGAAQLQADMVLVYSVDTSFAVDGKQYGPLSAISLGLLKNRNAHVTATVAGLLVDVRTGFIYGSAEASSSQEKKTSIWASRLAIDTARIAAEQVAFDEFVDEFGDLWNGVIQTHTRTALVNPAQSSANSPTGRSYHTVTFED